VFRILIRKFLWSPGPGSLIFCTDTDPPINEQNRYKKILTATVLWLLYNFWPGSESLSKRYGSRDTTSKWTQQFNNVRKASYTEYCTIHKGPGFLAVVWFGLAPPTPLPSVSKLSPFLSLSVCRRPILPKGEGGGRGGALKGTVAWDGFLS
jgi:hypothetical protein